MSDHKDACLGGFDNDHSTGTIVLVASDGKEYTVEKKHAVLSTLVSTSFETERDGTSIPIPNVRGEVLELVVEYLTHHAGAAPADIEKPLRAKSMKNVVEDQWDVAFIDDIGNERQKLYDLISAAHYMDIRGLLLLGCAKVASFIKGQPLEKIMDIWDPESKKSEADEKKV